MRSSRGCHGENVIFHFNGGLFCVPLLRSRTFLAAPSSPSRTTPFICFFSLLRSGILHRGPFIRGPVLVPSPFPPLFLFFLSLLLLLASASSTASFYLGANVLIACGPLFAPVSLSSFPSVSSTPRGYSAATDRRNCQGGDTRLTFES